MKLVVLDCDGTLVDSQNGICEAMTHAFTGFGLVAPTREATLAIVGL
jgi:phosphoglycolate phosphatase